MLINITLMRILKKLIIKIPNTDKKGHPNERKNKISSINCFNVNFNSR